MANLLTLVEYRTIMGQSTAAQTDDSQIGLLITAMSRAVQKYTDRNFEVAAGASTRSYQYDGSGYLDIDDCTNVTAVTTDAGVSGQTWTLTSDQWTAQPYAGEVFYYLLIHGGPFFGGSPQMGFTRNLDKYDALAFKPTVMTVTATWGWPAVPEDVKLATAWAVHEADMKPETSQTLTAESIEGYSRAWRVDQAEGALTFGLPSRSRDILDNYAKVKV